MTLSAFCARSLPFRVVAAIGSLGERPLDGAVDIHGVVVAEHGTVASCNLDRGIEHGREQLVPVDVVSVHARTDDIRAVAHLRSGIDAGSVELTRR